MVTIVFHSCPNSAVVASFFLMVRIDTACSAEIIKLDLFTTLRNHNISFFFFFNDTATTEIYTLSLHDALPIYVLVLEMSGSLGFVLEALELFSIQCCGKRQYLQCHPPGERDLFRFVDDAHGSPANLPEDEIGRAHV